MADERKALLATMVAMKSIRALYLLCELCIRSRVLRWWYQDGRGVLVFSRQAFVTLRNMFDANAQKLPTHRR